MASPADLSVRSEVVEPTITEPSAVMSATRLLYMVLLARESVDALEDGRVGGGIGAARPRLRA